MYMYIYKMQRMTKSLHTVWVAFYALVKKKIIDKNDIF